MHALGTRIDTLSRTISSGCVKGPPLKYLNPPLIALNSSRCIPAMEFTPLLSGWINVPVASATWGTLRTTCTSFSGIRILNDRTLLLGGRIMISAPVPRRLAIISPSMPWLTPTKVRISVT